MASQSGPTSLFSSSRHNCILSVICTHSLILVTGKSSQVTGHTETLDLRSGPPAAPRSLCDRGERQTDSYFLICRVRMVRPTSSRHCKGSRHLHLKMLGMVSSLWLAKRIHTSLCNLLLGSLLWSVISQAGHPRWVWAPQCRVKGVSVT